MCMVARYSKAARLLKTYVKENNLKLVRANFLWKKIELMTIVQQQVSLVKLFTPWILCSG